MPLGPSLTLRVGIPSLEILVVFHQLGADIKDAFSSRVSLAIKLSMSADRNDLSIVVDIVRG